MAQEVLEKQVTEDSEGDHISPSVLWKYSKHSARLTAEEDKHLKHCQDCVAIYILCHTCKSLQQIRMKLREVQELVNRR